MSQGCLPRIRSAHPGLLAIVPPGLLYTAIERPQRKFELNFGDFSSQISVPSWAYMRILPFILLLFSNIFMTYAWYGHLKDMRAKPILLAILLSWGVAFFEYCHQVPANRIGSAYFTLPAFCSILSLACSAEPSGVMESREEFGSREPYRQSGGSVSRCFNGVNSDVRNAPLPGWSLNERLIDPMHQLRLFAWSAVMGTF